MNITTIFWNSFLEFTIIELVSIPYHYCVKLAGGLVAKSVFHHLLIAAPENRRVARRQMSRREDKALSSERETSHDCAETHTLIVNYWETLLPRAQGES